MVDPASICCYSTFLLAPPSYFPTLDDSLLRVLCQVFAVGVARFSEVYTLRIFILGKIRGLQGWEIRKSTNRGR